jgi:hypothetical protein
MQLSRTGYGDWLARVDFTLPDLPPGVRMLEFCNDPCTVSTMGELTFGWFRVIPSDQDVSTYLLRDRLEEARRTLRQRARATKHRAVEAEHEARVLEQEVGRLRHGNRQLGEQVAALRRSLKRAPQAPGFPAPIGWLLVGLTVLFGMLAFRPRRKAPPARVTPMDPPAMERIDDPDPEAALRP